MVLRNANLHFYTDLFRCKEYFMAKRYLPHLVVATLTFAIVCLLLATTPVAAAPVTAESLVPPQMVLPAPWGLLKLLLLLTFFIHLLLVNILIGSVVMAAVNAWKMKPGGLDISSRVLPESSMQYELGYVPAVLALAVNFGVAPFLFAQVTYGSFLYSSSILMAVWWLSMPLAVIFGYYALYMPRIEPDGRLISRLLLTLVSLIFLYIAFLLSTNSTLMLRPDRWVEWFNNPGGRMLNLGDPTFVPRYLHMITASLAVGGLFLAARGAWLLRGGAKDQALQAQRIMRGLDWFFYASLVQVVWGLWFLIALPARARNLFLGQDILAVFALLLSLAGLLAALWKARTIRNEPLREAGGVRRVVWLTLGVVFIMVCIRDMVRDAVLRPYSGLSAAGGAAVPLEPGVELLSKAAPLPPELLLPVDQGQAAGFVIFLIIAVLGVIALVWLARISMRLFRPDAETAGEAVAGAAPGRKGAGEE